MMTETKSTRTLVRYAVGAACALLTLQALPAAAAGEFPYERELILEARRMGVAKRMPMLTVEPNGKAVIDLWCKTIDARVEIGEGTIRIDAAPLPEEMPQMMAPGQCSPERMQADQDMLASLAQATQWRIQGQLVVLNSPGELRFRPSSH